MVYHGRSKGCIPCRQRKVRCDLNKPHCHACVKRGITCPGPRVGKGETEFRTEYASTFSQQDPQCCPKEAAMRDANCQRPINPNIETEQKSSPDISWTEPVCFCAGCWTPTRADTSDGLILRPPSGGQYGNGSIGVCRADPSLISLLDFWRRMALYDRTPQNALTRPNLGKKAWALSLISLHDECLGYAFLAVASCYYAKVNKSYDMNVFHLNARMRSVRNARAQLESVGLAERMISNLCIVLAAEMVAEDWKACSQHARFLAGVLQPKEGNAVSVQESTRHSFLHMDVERATAMGTVPFVDLETWFYEKDALDEWTVSALSFATHPLAANPLPLDVSALRCPTLANHLVQIRHYSTLLSLPCIATSISRATAFQLSTAIDVIAGKLLVYYAEQSATVARTAYSEMLGHEYLNTAQQAGMSLAALYVLRLKGRQEWVGQEAERLWKIEQGLDDEETFMMERFCGQAHRIVRRLERVLRASERAFDSVLQLQRERILTDSYKYGSNLEAVNVDAAATDLSQVDANTTAATTPRDALHPAIRMRLFLLHVGAVIERTADFPQSAPSLSGSPPTSAPFVASFGASISNSASTPNSRPTYCTKHLRSLLHTLNLSGPGTNRKLLVDTLDAFLPLIEWTSPSPSAPASASPFPTATATAAAFNDAANDSVRVRSEVEEKGDGVAWLLDARLSAHVYGPRWMSPVLRTWGLTNWDGELDDCLHAGR